MATQWSPVYWSRGYLPCLVWSEVVHPLPLTPLTLPPPVAQEESQPAAAHEPYQDQTYMYMVRDKNLILVIHRQYWKITGIYSEMRLWARKGIHNTCLSTKLLLLVTAIFKLCISMFITKAMCCETKGTVHVHLHTDVTNRLTTVQVSVSDLPQGEHWYDDCPNTNQNKQDSPKLEPETTNR